MAQKRVLYADNDSDYLDARCEFLEDEGYQVIKAYRLEDAEQVLEQQYVHLAILDIRLQDDDDEGDISGILLAKDERYKRVPKIFVTGFPTYEAVRETYGSMIGDEKIAHAFLAKKEGHQALVNAVHSAFEKVVGINWDLQVTWDAIGLLSFPYLASLLESGLEPALLAMRSEELGDLFRKLFSTDEQISIVHLNWLRAGCACLTLFAHQNGSSRQSVVICGGWQAVQEHRRLAEQYLAQDDAPYKKPNYAESLRYAGLAYINPDTGRGPVQTGTAFFEAAGKGNVDTALENLYQQVLPFWHRHERSEINNADLAALYRDRLGIMSRCGSLEAARRIMQAVAESARSQSLVKEITLEGNEIRFDFPGGLFHQGPDPIPPLFDPQAFSQHQAVITTTFGGISADSLVIDAEGYVQPTDLTSITRSPLLEDFISMECEFHFDRIHSSNLQSLLDFEQQFDNAKTLNDTLTTGSVDPECRKALAAIQTIRKLAAEAAGDALEPYLIGLFHYMINGLLLYDPQHRLAKHQSAQMVYRLMAASLVIAQIKRLREDDGNSEANPVQETGLVINDASHEVSVDGREVHLTQTEFKLLAYLYKNPNRLCTREEILSEVFEIKRIPTEHDKGLLNTHMDRMRKKIDLNPAKHRYIVTKRGEGYRLVLKS